MQISHAHEKNNKIMVGNKRRKGKNEARRGKITEFKMWKCQVELMENKSKWRKI